jgi:hypothetical protein
MKLVLLTVATHKHRECTHMGSATTRAYVQRASMTSGGLGSLRSRRLVVSPLILAIGLSPQVVVPHQVRLGGTQVAQLAVLVRRQFLVGVAPLQHQQDLIFRELVAPPPPWVVTRLRTVFHPAAAWNPSILGGSGSPSTSVTEPCLSHPTWGEEMM